MKRHSLDLLSLVFGILFLVAAVAAATDTFAVRFLQFEWIAAAGLLVVGAILLLSVGRTSSRNGS
jgi:hypothetical protein